MSSNFAIPDKALRVESEGGDVFVYVGSFSQQTADGYMVLPTHLLGTEYIHSSRRDNQEKVRTVEYPMSAGPADGDFRTGFSCIAAKDQTVIRATLKATQTFCINYDRVGPNRTIQSPTLRQNEVWNVVNGINSYTNQVCDFTGTVV